MIKLIVTDLDGSLLNDDKKLPADFWEVEKALHDKGVVFAIASGRPLHNIAEKFAPIKDRTWFISDNGSYIVHRDEALLTLPLDNKMVKEFIALAARVPNAYPVLCGKEMAFVQPMDPELLKVATQYYSEYQTVEYLDAVEEPILKISLCDLDDAQTNSYPVFKQYENDFKVVVSGARWLDITVNDADKGRAVQFLQQKLNIAYEETMVFGDYLNDLEMMRTGKYSFAMKNAQPELLETANFITEKDNNEAGVTETIKKYML